MSEWDGVDTRKPNSDHDTLIELVQILKGHVNNFDSHVASFKEHEVRDESQFNALKKDAMGTQKVVWMATGALLAVQLIPTVFRVFHVINK